MLKVGFSVYGPASVLLFMLVPHFAETIGLASLLYVHVFPSGYGKAVCLLRDLCFVLGLLSAVLCSTIIADRTIVLGDFAISSLLRYYDKVNKLTHVCPHKPLRNITVAN